MTARQQHALSGLYVITDPSLTPSHAIESMVCQALKGGARIVQYRNKDACFNEQLQEARTVVELCRQFGAISIVNDSLELCLEAGADGLHKGQGDGDNKQIRTALGDRILGVTCHDSLQLALDAQAQGADYVAFGSLFVSPTKPQATPCSLEDLHQACNTLTIPVCAIGGITNQNVRHAIRCGANMAAVISGIFAHPDIQASAAAIAHQFSLER